jgi:hypothetical protein
MSYCTCRVAVKFEPQQRTAVSLKCRSWKCPTCQPDRQRRLVAEAASGAPSTFLTLTSRRRDGFSAVDAARELIRAWQLIRKRLMRRHGLKRLPFMTVMEATKAGWPHLHIMIRSVWLDRSTISKWMDELTSSPVVDIRRIDNKGRVAAYVAKYAGKCAEQFGTCKRYFKSQDYDLRSEQQKAKFQKRQRGWICGVSNIFALKRAWADEGFVVEWIDSHRIRGRLLC